jgi:hypothetical protein
LKVIFSLEVPLPKRKGSPINGANLVSPVIDTLKILVSGMWVIAVQGDEYRRIEAVYVDMTKPLDPIRVILRYDGRANARALLKLGWKEEA